MTTRMNPRQRMSWEKRTNILQIDGACLVLMNITTNKGEPRSEIITGLLTP